MPDLLTVVNMARYSEAERMLRDDPSRVGPDGGDTIALHVSVSKRNLATIRWLLAHGIDVNAKRPMWDLNHTALHMTIESGAIEIARGGLDQSANFHDADGRVPESTRVDCDPAGAVARLCGEHGRIAEWAGAFQPKRAGSRLRIQHDDAQ